eukprot:sb/3468162/
MGDCKLFPCDQYQVYRHWDPADDTGLPKSKKIKDQYVDFDTDMLGKLQLYRRMSSNKVMDNCLQITPETMPYVTDIVSASDKIALRNSIGYQGALLSTLLMSSIRFTDIYVSRSFHAEALERGLVERVRGFIPDPPPRIRQIKWKPGRMADMTCVYGFIWSLSPQNPLPVEIIRTDLGRAIPTECLQDDDPRSEGSLDIEAESALPSRYSSLEYYKAFCKVQNLLERPVSLFRVTKISAYNYQKEKQTVKDFYKTAGMGTWPNRIDKLNF